MNRLVEAAAKAVVDKYIRDIVAIINPEERAEIAYGLLGTAVAMCDTFGLDVPDFLKELRSKEPMPDVLVPPARQQS